MNDEVFIDIIEINQLIGKIIEIKDGE